MKAPIHLNESRAAESYKRAFTLIELLAIITIIAILASVIFVISMGVRKKAEQVQCGNNLKALHVALSAYLQDNGHWPQVNANVSDEEIYWKAWEATLKPYELPDKVWMCPTHRRVTEDDFFRYSSYHPMPFDANGPMTPYKWSNMPWVMEIGDNHGNGPLMIMPDGSIIPGMSIEQPLQTLKSRK